EIGAAQRRGGSRASGRTARGGRRSDSRSERSRRDDLGARHAYELAEVDDLEELHVPAEIVTARAVAPLDRLAGWCLPLAVPGGRMLALKGSSAAEEVAEHRGAVARLGGGVPVLRQCGVGLVEPPTTVVEVVRERSTTVARQ